MTLWFVLALMTAAAVFAVLWPLSRAHASATSAGDVAVYKDQLQEIERDRSAGRLPPGEADAARIEVSRRLLAAADRSPPQIMAVAANPWRRRAAAALALLVLPLGSVALYLSLGSPLLPDQPLAMRQQAPPQQRSLATLVSQVEAHLATHPDDVRGWEVVAPVYMRLGRFTDAVKARRNVLRILGASVEREGGLGEALAGEANGVVTAEAKAAFERALAIDPNDFRAKFFVGLAAEQDGRRAEAATIWRDLLAKAPPNASWSDFVRQAIVRVDDTALPTPGPTADDMAAAAGLSEQQRNDMVRGMVARLSERLKTEGADIEGWLRLVRAYTVLGDRDRARGAVSDARRALAAEPEKIRRLDDLVKGLGLEG